MADQIKLGTLIEFEGHRDAIHIAIAPVVAYEDLLPGDRIGFPIRNNQDLVSKCQDPIGIVDPFLTRPIKTGETFYMLLMPNTITSLRHDWTHPAFDERAYYPATLEKDSVRWLELFALKWGMDYGQMITEAVMRGCLVARGSDIHSWSEIDQETQAYFWHHLEVVTGKTFDATHREATGFSCSC